MKKNKSKVQKSFKSVTFDVKRTLNDSLFIFIHTDKAHYSPGEVINGSIFFNLLEPLPTDAIFLCVNGYEEVHFTLMANSENKEHNHTRKIFEIKQNIYQCLNGSLPKGELSFPFEIILPADLPSSCYYSDENANGGIKYEISIHIVSIDRRLLDNVHLRKIIDIINPEKVTKVEGYDKSVRCDTNFDSLKETLLPNSKLKQFEHNFRLHYFCCLGNHELTSRVTFENEGVVGRSFEISHYIAGEGISYVTYKLIKEIKMIDGENRIYFCKKVK
jgi:hypothetical protein